MLYLHLWAVPPSATREIWRFICYRFYSDFQIEPEPQQSTLELKRRALIQGVSYNGIDVHKFYLRIEAKPQNFASTGETPCSQARKLIFELWEIDENFQLPT